MDHVHTMGSHIENPETASWGLSISDADFAKLKHNILAKSSDDRWEFLAMTDEELANEALEWADRLLKTGSTRPVIQQMTEEEWEAELQRMEEETDKETRDEPPVDLNRGGIASIRRSWTGRELYRIAIKPREGHTSPKIETITWERTYHGDMSAEQAKIEVVFLCRAIAECDLDAAPDDDYQLLKG
ncbi:hypothetical protein SLS53_008825 [Cytospora paraplurivora]|uniref:Uncharacterized protein n=1 Tax=Cytospora paraplurivora TaxID=2898453 RepID=A0AAN9U0B4_9PEZI